MRISRLPERLEVLRRQMRELQTMEREVAEAPDSIRARMVAKSSAARGRFTAFPPIPLISF
jgi:hypothetical protein